MKPSIARKLLVAVGLAALPCLAIAQEDRDPSIVRLPPLRERQILGIWIETTGAVPCTRALERVRSDIFIVPRCKGRHFGEYGRHVVKMSARSYVPTGGDPRLVYVIREDGFLELHSGLQTMVLAPYKHPFPR